MPRRNHGLLSEATGKLNSWFRRIRIGGHLVLGIKQAGAYRTLLALRDTLFDLANLGSGQRPLIRLVLRQQLDGHCVQCKVDRLRLIDAPNRSAPRSVPALPTLATHATQLVLVPKRSISVIGCWGDSWKP